ncbi:hypothetical protein P3T25_006464 [Paraburkholderia sp. GAS32]
MKTLSHSKSCIQCRSYMTLIASAQRIALRQRQSNADTGNSLDIASAVLFETADR